MKVAAQFPPITQQRTDPHFMQPGSSFAELLEQGASARSIVANRALGFSETGLMGLSFATGAQTRTPTIQPATEPAGIDAQAQPLPGNIPNGVAATPVERPSISAFKYQAGAGRTPAHSEVGRPHNAQADFVGAPGGMAKISEAIAGKIYPSTSPSTLTTRMTPPIHIEMNTFRVKLYRDDDELIVSVEGLSLSDEERLHFGSIARSIGSERGMTVGRLVVSPE